MTKPSAEKTTSVGRKYTRGYFLLLYLMVIVLIASFVSNLFLSRSYSRMMQDMLDINQTFSAVEKTNACVYEYYLYLHPQCSEDYAADRKEMEKQMAVLKTSLYTDYSRETQDLYGTVETYCGETQAMVDMLGKYVADRNAYSYEELEQKYTRTQTLYSYIGESFKDVYGAKLIKAEALQQRLDRIRMLLLLLEFATLLVAVAVVLRYYQKVVRGIIRAMEKLTAFAEKISQDTATSERVNVDTGDEFSVFAHTFNHMLDVIQAQMQTIQSNARAAERLQKAEMENLRMSTALQTSRYKLLQSQINPHFLFNTLNMISQSAYLESAPETASMIEATADLLRYNLRQQSQSATLKDEIQNVKNYMYIQSCRFGDRISFTCKMEEEMAAMRVPSMILQPFVENAISHGVKAMLKDAVVEVKAFSAKDRLILTIHDNGCGIPAEMQERLLEEDPLQEPDSEHIGVCNTFGRIRMFFGDSVRFTINSAPGSTTFEIDVPQLSQ
jgi:two-component system sensor histidine kinase YesM